MKKYIRAAALLLSLFLLAAGCSQPREPSAGDLYLGSEVNILGDNSPFNEVYNKGENEIELLPDGTGTFTINGDALDITYQVSGTDFVMTHDGVDCVGTLEDDVLVFDYFGMGIEMIFVKT